MAIVYVRLAEELVDVWRPVSAEHVRDDVYRILEDPVEGEVWEFAKCAVVRCQMRPLVEGTVTTSRLVALESAI